MYKILIVDDERLARIELKRLLSEYSDIQIVGEAKNANEALNIISEKSIDLVFVDINMPEIDGLQLVAEFDENIKFVFCTAFQEHAVDAFSLNAFDYIVKPVEPSRLDATLKRFRLSESNLESRNEFTYLNENHGLLLKIGKSRKIVRLKDIERMETEGNYVAVYTRNEQSLIYTSLKKLEKKLDPKVFFKVSRSVILRVDCIQTIEDGFATGSLLAMLKSGREIEISRRQANALKKLFDL